MAPFMDSRQDLSTLMSKVLALDVTNGLRQLETVNANITLIRLWFSRAEVSGYYGTCLDKPTCSPKFGATINSAYIYVLGTCTVQCTYIFLGLD
jgi:hypothetical protein